MLRRRRRELERQRQLGERLQQVGRRLSSGSFGGSGGSRQRQRRANGPPLIYAHTDTELYSMDPKSHQVTDIGPFSDGSGTTPTMTDLAVDGNDNVWVNSETAVYKAALPARAPARWRSPLQTSRLRDEHEVLRSRLHPRGHARDGRVPHRRRQLGGPLLRRRERRVGHSAEPRQLRRRARRGTYELSGDIVFYTLNGSPRGLATIRSCESVLCSTTDDYLVEVDVAALQQAYQSKAPAASLLKQRSARVDGLRPPLRRGRLGQQRLRVLARAGLVDRPPSSSEIEGTGTGRRSSRSRTSPRDGPAPVSPRRRKSPSFSEHPASVELVSPPR